MSFEMDRVRHIGDVSDGAWGAMSKLTFTTKVMPLFGLALLIAAGGTFAGLAVMSWPLYIAAIVGQLALCFTVPWWQRKSGVNMVLFVTLAFLSGLVLVPLLTWAGARGGIMLIAQALTVSTVTFIGLAAYGLTTKRDFANMGGYLFVGMLGLLVAGIFNIFFQSSMLSLVCSIFGVGIFAAFTVYDMNQIRNTYEDADYIGAAMALFLDFIFLFTSILRLFGLVGGGDD